MKYRFPSNDVAEPQFTVVPETEALPENIAGFNMGAGRVVAMNETAARLYSGSTQAVFAVLAALSPTGHAADVPFSEAS